MDVSNTKEPHLLYHPLGMSRASDNRVTTEIVANISRSKKGGETFVPSYFAICTLDGKNGWYRVQGRTMGTHVHVRVGCTLYMVG